MKNTKLTQVAVEKIITSFLEHIRDNWEFYKNNLPHLRRTMMFYNEFAYGIRFLPENDEYAIEFNPKYPLLEDLPRVFGKDYTDEIGDLIYGAWPLRKRGKEWMGYEEPIPDTPQTLREKYPDMFGNDEDARVFMYEVLGTGYGDYEGVRCMLSPGGTPEIWYRGFTTVEESPEQKAFLDAIRNHPRIIEGIAQMEKAFSRGNS